MRQRHFCAHGNLVLCGERQTQEVAWASGPPPQPPAADLCACCMMDCLPVRWFSVRRAMVGAQVMAVHLGTRLALHITNLFPVCKSPAFLGVLDYCHQFSQYFPLIKT